MCDEFELKEAIKNRLEKTGDLKKLKCQLRMMTFEILKNRTNDDNERLSPQQQQQPPHVSGNGDGDDNDTNKLSNETDRINRLIYEFFKWNGYHYCAEMLMTETGFRPDDRLATGHRSKPQRDLPDLYYLIALNDFCD